MAKRLTRNMIEAAKPDPNKRVEIPDAGCPGLYLVVQPSGKKSWALRYRSPSDGKPRKLTLNGFGEIASARKQARAALDIIDDGGDPAGEKREAKRIAQSDEERDAFENVADEWLKRDQAKNRTFDEVKRAVARELKPKWKGRHIASITRRDALELIDGIADRGSPVMARRVQSYLHRLFRWSVGRGIIEANPVTDLPKPGSETKRDRVLSDTELALVWRAAMDTSAPFGPVFRLLILTGARREEIGALRWAELDGDTIRLKGERTKNNEAHDIPLSPEALAIIEAAPRIEAVDDDGRTSPSEFVFTVTGSTGVSGWSKAKRLLDAKVAKLNDGDALPYWRLHDLRRTVATAMQRLGVNLQTIEAVLGHVSGSRAGIVGVYQRHEFTDEAREALDAWSRYVALIADAKAWALTAARLNTNDRDKSMRARRRFNAAIIEGGKAWQAYLAALQSDGAKVVPLRT